MTTLARLRTVTAVLALSSACADAPGPVAAGWLVDDDEAVEEAEETPGAEGPSDAGGPAIALFALDGDPRPGPIAAARAVEVTVEAPGATEVEIWDGEALVAKLAAAPFVTSWLVDDRVAEAPRTLTAVARDAGGAASAPSSIAVSFALPAGGTTRWEAVDDEAGAGLAALVAPDGDVVVVGEVQGEEGEGSQVTLRRFEPATGALRWEGRFPAAPSPGVRHVGRALALAPDGGIVVAGEIAAAGEAPQLWLSRHEADGSWSGGAAGEGAGRAVVTLAGGDAVIAGYVGGGEGTTPWLRRVRADGSEVWSVTPAAGEFAWAEARALAAMGDGSVVVAGAMGDGGGARAFVSRVSASGVALWSRSALPPGIDRDAAEAVAVSGRGEVVVAATAQVSGDPRDRVEIRRMRAEDGATVTVEAAPGGGGDERARALAVDRYDRIVVAATRVDALGEAEAVTLKLSRDGGALLWSQGQGGARAAGVAVDALGYAYVVGGAAAIGGEGWWMTALHP